MPGTELGAGNSAQWMRSELDAARSLQRSWVQPGPCGGILKRVRAFGTGGRTQTPYSGSFQVMRSRRNSLGEVPLGMVLKKHYLPINYKIRVPYEGVLRVANVTRLRAWVSQQELRYLWVWVSLSATESVQEVLLEDHPSWKYLQDVHRLLVDVQQGLMGVKVGPKVEAVLSLLSAPGLSLKLVRPKALLDNCFRVMELLYCSCCKQSSILNWQNCEVLSPQPHSPEPSSSQCVAAQLYSLSQQPPTSLPHSLGSQAGPPAQ
ncbi:PREDICTED: interleukin-34 isoform X2 [Hipposideros armiger]|uniref:Interleukin-34 n=1 Tax=Hipposideros armiger TaxID=186990 RepID=A0A8B7SAB8_HIPAR|nr:PREDICTED: interleukin-34 isoform X2 [Hipposideros armiger]